MDLCFGFSVAEHWCFFWFCIWVYMKIFVLFDWFMNLNSKSLCNCWLKKKKKNYVIVCCPSYIVGLIQVRLQFFSPSNIDDNKILKFKSWKTKWMVRRCLLESFLCLSITTQTPHTCFAVFSYGLVKLFRITEVFIFYFFESIDFSCIGAWEN